MAKAAASTTIPEVKASSRAEWRRWLAAHHADTGSIWLVYPKKDAGTDLTYAAIVEEALCFGWIDSVPRKRDDGLAMIRVSPRKAGSAWSKINKERVAALIASKRMRAPGRAKIDAARRDGSWAALDSVEALEIPGDLAAALRRDPVARRNFSAFPRGSRKIILGWIAGAKRPQTRAARIAETVHLAAQGVRANHYRQ